MANTKIKDSVYKAIDVIVGKRIEDLHLDKTISAIVEACIDSSTNKYKLRYGSGVIYAYAEDGQNYFPNTKVFVLVPENNFNNTKTIIGKANTGSQTNDTEEDNFSSTTNNFGVIGRNILSPVKADKSSFYLQSWRGFNNSITLYDINDPGNNKINVDQEALRTYLQESVGIKCSAKFRSNLSNIQIENEPGDYGLVFNITLKNGQTSFSSMKDRWEVQAPKTKAAIEEEDGTKYYTIDNYKKLIESEFDKTWESVDKLQTTLNDDLQKLLIFNVTVKNSWDESIQELANLYIELVNDLTIINTNQYGQAITVEDIKQQYNDWFEGESYAFKETPYSIVLSTDNMTGNVFKFTKPSYQYTFAEFDAELFSRVDSIYFYSNFKENLALSAKGSDIGVSDISITCIKALNNENGDYRLDLNYSDTYFSAQSANSESITITASIKYQKTQDLTSASYIQWFKKDLKITSDSNYFSRLAGEGWRSLNTGSQLTIVKSDNPNYRNYYKVIGLYESSLPVTQEFIIYNNTNQHDIEIVSNSGTTFGQGIESKILTCEIDKSTLEASLYDYIWYKDNEQITIETENITWNESNQIIVSPEVITSLDNKVTFSCIVIDARSNGEIGSAELTLNKGQVFYLKNYWIEIVNGNQVFQYNESGISPSSDIFETPIVPNTLSCKFYDPNGGLIDPLKYTVQWEIPISNTLINVDETKLDYNTDGTKNLIKENTCSFSLKNEYNYSAVNNQIVCIVNFENTDYRQSTNFFFGKVGDSGTNGTDIVAKIDVIPNQNSQFWAPYNNNRLETDLLTLEVTETTEINEEGQEEKTYTTQWNNGLQTSEPILQFSLYRKNDIIDPQEYQKTLWSIASNTSRNKHLAIRGVQANNLKQCAIDYDATKTPNNSYTNYVIKAQAELPIDDEHNQTYYNFFPICVDTQYGENDIYTIGISRAKTLRQAVYNADGRDPKYSGNLGVGLKFVPNLGKTVKDIGDKTIYWTACGGDGEEENNPSFTLGKSKTYVPTYEGAVEDTAEKLQKEWDNKVQELQTKYSYSIDIWKNNIQAKAQAKKDAVNEEKNSIKNEQDELKETLIKELQKVQTSSKEKIEYALLRASNAMKLQLARRKRDQKIENSTETSKTETVTPQELIDSIATPLERFIQIKNGSGESIKLNSLSEFLTNIINTDNITEKAIFEWKPLEIQVKKDTEEEKKSSWYYWSFDMEEWKKEEHWNWKEGEDEPSIVDIEKRILEATDEINTLYNIAMLVQRNILNIDIENYQSFKNQLYQLDAASTSWEKIISPEDSSNIFPTTSKEIEDYIFGITENINVTNDGIQIILNEIKDEYAAKAKDIALKYDTKIKWLQGLILDEDDPTYCQIIPNNVYNGEYLNQYVKIQVYKGFVKDDDENKVLEHKIIVPFHMSLNTYGLASLNAWDGNSVEINEEGGYVLAPQIGAGVKHVEDNTFTGILMGTEKTYDDPIGEEEIGLLGYSHGKRSIFLDATTGNAIFGLPEVDAADGSNPLTEGRIELRPGGTSSISKWKFDSRSLYRVASEDETEWLQKNYTTYKQQEGSSLGAPYDDAPQYAHGSIPHKQQGILLSALPAYASFKGRMLNEKDQSLGKVDYTNSSTTVREGDTFELQIDPNDSRFFSLYEHSPRLGSGEGICRPIKWFLNPENVDNISEADKTIIQNLNYTDSTYILCQSYTQNRAQRYLPLSALVKKEKGKRYWECINFAVNSAGISTNEMIIGIGKTYSRQNVSSSKYFIWKFISLTGKQLKDVVEVSVEPNPTFSAKEKISVTNSEFLTITLVDEEELESSFKWRRYRKAGIDATGKFAVEAIGFGGLSLGLERISAFSEIYNFMGINAASSGAGEVIRMFIKQGSSESDPVYISSTQNLGEDEGKRPVRIYGGQTPSANDREAEVSDQLYASGIFVGKNSSRVPDSGIAKIEVQQKESLDNNIITLSALGSKTSETDEQEEVQKSIFQLQTSSDNSTALGFLKHDGQWETNIANNVNTTIGGALTFIGNDDENDENSIILQGNLTFKGHSQTGQENENIYKNEIVIDNFKTSIIHQMKINSSEEEKYQRDGLILQSTKDDTTWTPTELFGYRGVKITGGLGNSAGAALNNSVAILATNTSHGLYLGAANNEPSTWGGSAVRQQGDNGPTGNINLTGDYAGQSYIKLLPAANKNSDKARIYMRAGNHSYLYSETWKETASSSNRPQGFVIGPHLMVGAPDSKGIPQWDGMIWANGIHITNTCGNNNGIYGLEQGKDITLSKGFQSFPVLGLKVSSGRPTFSSYNIRLKLPSDLMVARTVSTGIKNFPSWLTFFELGSNDALKRTSAAKTIQDWAQSVNTAINTLANNFGWA